MNILPTHNQLALSCLTLYCFLDSYEIKLKEMIKESSRLIGSCTPPRCDLGDNVSMKVSMNNQETVFINFTRIIYGSNYQQIAEIIIHNNGDISVRGEKNPLEGIVILINELTN